METVRGRESGPCVKLTKEPRQRLRFLEPEEEDRLLAECAEPLRTLVLVGTNCGLRLKSEALTLRWADVDVVRRTLTVAAAYAKSGTSRTVSLNSTVLAALIGSRIAVNLSLPSPTESRIMRSEGFVRRASEQVSPA